LELRDAVGVRARVGGRVGVGCGAGVAGVGGVGDGRLELKLEWSRLVLGLWQVRVWLGLRDGSDLSDGSAGTK